MQKVSERESNDDLNFMQIKNFKFFLLHFRSDEHERKINLTNAHRQDQLIA
jgi:hypothetical protein